MCWPSIFLLLCDPAGAREDIDIHDTEWCIYEYSSTAVVVQNNCDDNTRTHTTHSLIYKKACLVNKAKSLTFKDSPHQDAGVQEMPGGLKHNILEVHKYCFRL